MAALPALPTADPTACTRPPGENFSYRLGFGPCDCDGCRLARALDPEPNPAHAAELAAYADFD